MADASLLPVVETFHSLQGEGHHAGRSAFFIRLAGCTVGCAWCDTKHSWPSQGHPERSIDDLAEAARMAAKAGASFIVITGGEPLHHELQPLTQALDAHCGLPLHLETSGVDPLSGRFDWITLSPKRHQPPLPALLNSMQELKVVIHAPEDLHFADAMAQAGQGEALRYLQPGWNSPEGQRLAIDHVRRHPAWRLSLQAHKWLGVR